MKASNQAILLAQRLALVAFGERAVYHAERGLREGVVVSVYAPSPREVAAMALEIDRTFGHATSTLDLAGDETEVKP